MDENESLILPSSGVCQTFVPQQWRKTKCKLCFHDMVEHKTTVLKEEKIIPQVQSETEERNDKSYAKSKRSVIRHPDSIHKAQQDTDESILLPSLRTISASALTENSCSSQSYTHGSSAEHLDSIGAEGDDVSNSNAKDSPGEYLETDEALTPLQKRKWKKRNSSLYALEKQDSLDEGVSTPVRFTQKRRTRSYRKNSSNLLQFSAMMRSSNSSLCSYNSELTDGYSDYDYDVRSVTDDTDDYADCPDVIDELEQIKPELIPRVQYERKVSRSKIFDLERELEGQQDYIRANEIAKDRQIRAYQREIEGLKLELSSLKAHENILALKSRLELEGKSNRIADLEQLNKSLQEECNKLSYAPDITDVQQEVVRKELERAQKTIALLEDEKQTFEKKLQLAEDLQHNDRELLEVYRNQLSSLDADYASLQKHNEKLEEKCKKIEIIRNDYVAEQEQSLKLTKEIENLKQKVKRRDRHIEDLEDDNVKMQQIKRDLESQLAKKELKMKKIENKMSDLQNEVTRCNKEIADLTGENRKLEQARRLTDLRLKEANGNHDMRESQVQEGEKKFIATLQDRLAHMESRAKELELENENYIKEIRELHTSIISTEKQTEDYKEQTQDMEIRINKLKQENKHCEKKLEMMQRKLQKSEKEKKRALNRQRNAEMKLVEYQQELCSNASSAVTAGNNLIGQTENETRMMKLKLESTQAKLSMIEGTKSYMESKIISLERRVRDKENEIQRLHESLERDSGAPSQDYDRLDALERENVMLQTKLDDVIMENNDHRDYINQLQDNNARLEATIAELTEKLEQCTRRLKEVEEANHKLGREALRRSESKSHVQPEGDSNVEELKRHNKILQEKVKSLENLEELVEQLENDLKKEKVHKQWYADENERNKSKILKLSDKIKTLEESNRNFQLNIRDLTDTNIELRNDVKRLEQKLEIYGELFGQDSKLYASLKRRSYQHEHREHDEAKIIENALSPLMEEIQEKDALIKTLNSKLKEKDLAITALNDEIALWETNITTIFGDKNTIFGDKNKTPFPFTSDCHDTSNETVTKSNELDTSVSKSQHQRISVEQTQHQRISVEINFKDEDSASQGILRNQLSEKENSVERSRQSTGKPASSELTVTEEEFYKMIHEHTENLKKKDEAYYRNALLNNSDEESSNSLYQAIERGLLDRYSDSDNSPRKISLSDSTEFKFINPDSVSPKISSSHIHLSNIREQEQVDGVHEIEEMNKSAYRNTEINQSEHDSADTNKHTVKVKADADKHTGKVKGAMQTDESDHIMEDMYEQLVQLENMINRQTTHTQAPPTNNLVRSQNVSVPSNNLTHTELSAPQPLSYKENDEGVRECVTSKFATNFRKSNSPRDVPPGNATRGNTASLMRRFSSESNRTYTVPASVCHVIDRASSAGNITGIARRFSTERAPCYGENFSKLCGTSSHRSLNEPVDLSALDDLLAEVESRKSSESQESLALSEQDARTSTESIPATLPTKVTHSVMPSIRTAKRRIIRLGGLNRSGSFDSATATYRNWEKRRVPFSSSSADNSSNSSMSSISQSDSGSSGTSHASVNSVIYVPAIEKTSTVTSGQSSSPTIPPHRRANVKSFNNSLNAKFPSQSLSESVNIVEEYSCTR